MHNPRITSNIGSLLSKRSAFLTRLFAQISYKGANINVCTPSSGGSLFIGISDGKESGINYRDWRFQSSVQHIYANYHEVWNNIGKDKYFLVRSYLHLYVIDDDFSEKEYILLHCDASEPDDTPHSLYKQSPHIHIEVAPHPIPKAHIALFNGRQSEILSDIKSFDNALIECINLIDSQFLKLH